jgi:hypothetical protein
MKIRKYFQKVCNFKLFQNYPNPFNPTTRIKFDLPASGFVSIKIYDVMGRKIENIVNENLKAGSYEVEFNGVINHRGFIIIMSILRNIRKQKNDSCEVV